MAEQQQYNNRALSEYFSRACELCHEVIGTATVDNLWLCTACAAGYVHTLTRKEDMQAPELRQNTIGGSDIPAILGLDPYGRDRFSVWAEKHGYAAPRVETWRMKWGRLIQKPAIEEAYPDITRRRARFFDQPIVSPRREWMRVTPDGFCIDEKRGIECKCVSWDQRHAWPDGGVPLWVEAQVRYYMAALAIDRYDVLAVFGMDEPCVVELERDPDVENWIIDQAEEFHARYIAGNEQPPIGASSAAAEYLRTRYPYNRTKLRQATPEEALLLDEYAQVRAEEREVAEERKRIEIQIRACIGEAEGITWSRGRFTWKNTRDCTDWKRLAFRLMDNFTAEQQLATVAEYSSPGSRRIYFSCEGDE